MIKRILVYILALILFLGSFVFGISSEQRTEAEQKGSIICLSCIGIG
jgi:preprotein translocase subunit YajC